MAAEQSSKERLSLALQSRAHEWLHQMGATVVCPDFSGIERVWRRLVIDGLAQTTASEELFDALALAHTCETLLELFMGMVHHRVGTGAHRKTLSSKMRATIWAMYDEVEEVASPIFIALHSITYGTRPSSTPGPTAYFAVAPYAVKSFSDFLTQVTAECNKSILGIDHPFEDFAARYVELEKIVGDARSKLGRTAMKDDKFLKQYITSDSIVKLMSNVWALPEDRMQAANDALRLEARRSVLLGLYGHVAKPESDVDPSLVPSAVSATVCDVVYAVLKDAMAAGREISGEELVLRVLAMVPSHSFDPAVPQHVRVWLDRQNELATEVLARRRDAFFKAYYTHYNTVAAHTTAERSCPARTVFEATGDPDLARVSTTDLLFCGLYYKDLILPE
jgi:hypothetical protein